MRLKHYVNDIFYELEYILGDEQKRHLCGFQMQKCAEYG